MSEKDYDDKQSFLRPWAGSSRSKMAKAFDSNNIKNYDMNYMSVGSNVTHEMEFPGQSHTII